MVLLDCLWTFSVQLEFKASFFALEFSLFELISPYVNFLNCFSLSELISPYVNLSEQGAVKKNLFVGQTNFQHLKDIPKLFLQLVWHDLSHFQQNFEWSTKIGNITC